jgi:hypothetical protein
MLRSGNGIQKRLGVEILVRRRVAWSGLAQEREV